MTAISHQESTVPTAESIEDWLSLLVLLQKLQERLAEDRQSWAITGGDMALLIEALRMELQRLQELRPQVEQEIKRSLQDFSQQAIQVQTSEISSKLTAAVSSIFENVIQSLNQAAQKAIDQLQYSQDYIRNFKGWILVFSIILCTLSSIGGGYIVHVFDPIERLSAEQWQLIQNGAILRKAWPNLSKIEQDKIMGLFREEDTKSLPLCKR